MFQNLLEIRWWESFLNFKCTSNHVKRNRGPLPTYYLPQSQPPVLAAPASLLSPRAHQGPPAAGGTAGERCRGPSLAQTRSEHCTACSAQAAFPSTAPAAAATSREITRQEAQSPGRVKIFLMFREVFWFCKHITVFANGERVSAPLGATESWQIRKHGQIRSSVGHTPRQQWSFPQLRPDPPSPPGAGPPSPRCPEATEHDAAA